MNPYWKKWRQLSDAAGEASDCTVIACAIVCGIGYDEAHRLLAQYGRKPRGGCHHSEYYPAIRSLGFTLKTTLTGRFAYSDAVHVIGTHAAQVRHPWASQIRTVTSAERVLRKHSRGRRYIVHCRGHVAAFDGEQIVDWTAGRKHQVAAVTEVC